ncbi:hypothetical protein EYF80_009251 [Liparis tanakae]|uniref:Uncharacterized protein n=1 Tax=Liparis tanakae TaxID=230148 RepID=A0A4Z2IT74_9TELE|nr:hypothetical protein EYF80_009251 [Liparis tanakae]
MKVDFDNVTLRNDLYAGHLSLGQHLVDKVVPGDVAAAGIDGVQQAHDERDDEEGPQALPGWPFDGPAAAIHPPIYIEMQQQEGGGPGCGETGLCACAGGMRWRVAGRLVTEGLVLLDVSLSLMKSSLAGLIKKPSFRFFTDPQHHRANQNTAWRLDRTKYKGRFDIDSLALTIAELSSDSQPPMLEELNPPSTRFCGLRRQVFFSLDFSPLPFFRSHGIGVRLCQSWTGASSQPGRQTSKQMDRFGLNPSHTISSSWSSSFNLHVSLQSGRKAAECESCVFWGMGTTTPPLYSANLTRAHM